jgi:hypothetical protein
MTGEQGVSASRPGSVRALALVSAACAGLLFAVWILSPALSLPSPYLAYVASFLAVTGMTLSAAAVAPVTGWRSLAVILAATVAALGAVLWYAEGLPLAVSAVVVTFALLLAGAALGGAVGGRIEHPGHLLAVAAVSVLVDSFSVFHPSGPAAAVVARPAVIAVVALPWPVLGSRDLAPVLGVGDVVFAALYLAASRRFGLGVGRTAIAVGLGLIATMVGVMATRLPLPALVGMGIAVVAAHPRARRLPPKDRKQALVVFGVLALLWVLLWLRR